MYIVNVFMKSIIMKVLFIYVYVTHVRDGALLHEKHMFCFYTNQMEENVDSTQCSAHAKISIFWLSKISRFYIPILLFIFILLIDAII